jgi:class 3 adenylate cyclase/predicted ATPase
VDIEAWLRELGLERYEQAFRENEIDAEILPKLTADDLKDIGVTTVGHRRKLLEAIAALAEPASAPQAELSAPAEVTPRARSAEAERRQLTVSFCDLVGSTELAARLDPEDMGRVIRAYQECCTEVVERWGGHVAKYMGDGVLAYFGWPQAHEDDAERAVRAGLELVAAVGRLGEPQAKANAPLTSAADGRVAPSYTQPTVHAPLAARIGIATGLVMVGESIGDGAAREEAVVGEAPNLAARLQALAAPGSVVISQSSRRLVGGLFELADLGPQRLKGFAEPLAAWRVEGEGRAEGRFEALHGQHLTPLVGREHELSILLERWAWAKDGDGQVVLLTGEPGVGKSRVVHVLRERLGSERYMPLSHYCSPHHTNSALYPVIGLLERAAGFARDEPPHAKLSKLEALLAGGTERLAEAVPLVAALLGIPTEERYADLSYSPQRQKERTLEIFFEQLEGLAAIEPVLAIYEDVHWIDPTTLEMLDLFVDRIQALRVLVLVTFRPEFAPPWSGYAHVTHLPLHRLGRRQGAALVSRLTAGKALPAEVEDQILAKTDGVPLFVEELTKVVLESGLLREAGDRYELTGPLPPVAIPATLHDSLMARLDRLAPVKEVAQIGAIIGREFSHELLDAVTQLDAADLDRGLSELVRAELIFRRGTPPEATYSFKHAMVQEAAYQSLLKSKRQQLHARIASVLQERFPDFAEQRPEELARHLTEAGLVESAVDQWHKAGQQAADRSANLEAMAQLKKALELLKAIPESRARDEKEAAVQITLGVALIAVKGYGGLEVQEAYARALELRRKTGNTDDLFPVLRGLWNWHLLRSDMTTTSRLATQLVDLAQSQRDADALVAAHRAIGSTLLFVGNFAEAKQRLEHGLVHYDRRRHRSYTTAYGEDPGVVCRLYAAWCMDFLGYREEALRQMDHALALARELAHPFSLAFALSVSQYLRVQRREPAAAAELADAARLLCSQHGFAQWTAQAVFQRGWASFALGEEEEGLAEMRRGLTAWQAMGVVLLTPFWFAHLIEAHVALGERDAAESLISDALEEIARTGSRYFEAEIHRIRGELLWPSDHDVAAGCFHQALQIARDQDSKLLELRAATSLARLWARQGRRLEAHDLLAPIYGWFTEGFDTADLKDAKALLDELG